MAASANGEELSLLQWEEEASVASVADSRATTSRGKKKITHLSDGSKLAVDLDFESDDDEELVKLERSSTFRKRLVVLWPLELAVLCVEHLQYSAILLSMSLYWAFPLYYIQALDFVFWVNFNAWDYSAVHTRINNLTAPLDRVYRGARGSNLPSEDIQLDYAWIVRGWVIALALLTAAVPLVWMLLWRLRRFYQHRSAIFYMLVTWLAILLALPALRGSTRVFQCRMLRINSVNASSRDVVDTINSMDCHSLAQTGLVVVSVLFVMLPLCFIVPVSLYYTVRKQLVSPCPRRHEAYVQLKEAEFGQGLSDSWLLGKWTLFAALKRRAVFYHAQSFLLKFTICVATWLSHDQRSSWKTGQASLCLAAFGLWILWSVFAWRGGPFRLVALNVAHYASMACLLLVSLLGAMVAGDLETPLLRGELLQTYLIVINSLAVGLLLCVWIFLTVEWIRGRRAKGRGVWPGLFARTSRKDNLDQTTSRYLLAMLRAKQCVREAKQGPAILAPCHELARHIQIINAYCREAEHDSDRIHCSLWQVLDELTALHSVLMHKSIFADSSKESVRYCANELRRLLPDWTKALRQRQKDFILMKPVKRRILLKLYVMSLFLSKCGQSAVRPSTFGQLSAESASRQRTKSKSGVRFADTDDVQTVSSGEVDDYLRSVSQSTLGLDDDDPSVHDRFLRAIDELLPEHRSRAFSSVSTFSVGPGSSDSSRPATSDTLDQLDCSVTMERVHGVLVEQPDQESEDTPV